MLVGIVSDTHDATRAINHAVNALRYEKVDLILHAGDFTTTESAEAFLDVGAPIVGVYGNCDHELRRNPPTDITLLEGPVAFPIPGTDRTVWMAHEPEKVIGTEPEGTDVIIHGHLHRVVLETPEEGPWIVNPGECCGERTGRSTLALWNTDEHSLWILDL
jgi:putative phosphoesterase